MCWFNTSQLTVTVSMIYSCDSLLQPVILTVTVSMIYSGVIVYSSTTDIFTRPPRGCKDPPVELQTLPPLLPTQCDFFCFLMFFNVNLADLCFEYVYTLPKHLSIPPNFKFLGINLNSTPALHSSYSKLVVLANPQ